MPSSYVVVGLAEIRWSPVNYIKNATKIVTTAIIRQPGVGLSAGPEPTLYMPWGIINWCRRRQRAQHQSSAPPRSSELSALPIACPPLHSSRWQWLKSSRRRSLRPSRARWRLLDDRFLSSARSWAEIGKSNVGSNDFRVRPRTYFLEAKLLPRTHAILLFRY